MDPQEGPWLYGYALKGLASLQGPEFARVGPLAKVNFLVGRNNHGKSTVMRAARAWTQRWSPSNWTQQPEVQTLIPVPTEWVKQNVGPRRLADRVVDDLVDAGSLVIIDPQTTGLWVEGQQAANKQIAPQTVAKTLHALVPDKVHQVNIAGLGERRPTVPDKVVIIPAFRELRRFEPQLNDAGLPTTRPYLASGQGLVRELGSWQSPTDPDDPAYDEARERWDLLREFMRDVLEEPQADLEVANNQEDLHVKLSQAGRMLKINSLGDGIKQVLMIAAACILYSDHLVLLEEPEIHLHAGLQRKLMRFLAAETDNQYLIATHSAHVLDLPGAQIFHVTHDGTSTKVAPAVRASDVQKICQDLGYMASDLLQANYTIWVEGPSDRIYWGKWLSLVDPDLVEGVHFTIMVYGGYLIDGVHLQDETTDEVRELIQLLQLGRQCTVIADSDKSVADSPLRETLLRLRTEAAKAGSGDLLVCEWASTVENLVPRQLFRDVVIARHSVAGKRLRSPETHDPFSKPFEGMANSSYSKVEIATLIREQLKLEHIDDQLHAEVSALAGRIRLANGLPA